MPDNRPDTTSPPASVWVKFLRNYGPIPTNENLFDEHVTKALARAGVRPVVLPTPRLEEMKDIVSAAGCSLLVAGTAGDGKTYHCRKLWSELGGVDADWASPGSIKRLDLDGREIVFVKDLSELGEAEGEEILEGLEASFSGDDTVSYVVATNHGQILDRLRRRVEKTGSPSQIRQTVQQAFINPGAQNDRLAVVDLSRAASRGSLEDVLRAVAEHPDWERCEECSLNSGDRICPIAENRARVIGASDDKLFAKRLGDLVELSRLNGAHLPVRDLLALATNILLGHPDVKEDLMKCQDVHRIQDDGTVDKASLYRNVFGSNLTKKRAMARPVFRMLSVFGAGQETANGIDGLLVYGFDDTRLRESFDRLVANDRFYGASPAYLAAQRRYLEGEEGVREDEDDDAFLARLADQRRRLFFTLPDDSGPSYPNWGLTSFRHAGDYLATVQAVEGRRSAAADKASSMLVKGLNRVFTGLLVENTDRLFVADGGGAARSRTSVLCQTEVPVRRSAGMSVSVCKDEGTGIPCMDVVVASGQPAVRFHMTPVRFEFLCRVAEGALPGSFSNECLEDLLAFKARLLGAAETARKAESEDSSAWDDAQTLDLSFIEVNDRNGQGALHRVTLRVPE
ncbi:Uncharacterized protein AC496_4937 [Pseudomonas savastanoi pv. glycinea]|uniref:Uncharacterized protein n=2 Tax=Pseudomonas savastanoi TaxID=29438 RepID=A0AB74B275_PSESG|nr:Uncharacterized protein AC497_4202 [Pseudomonas savastanoi pv. glycinea]KPC36395.1 Uncharacterized protein AC498_4839 [Pseudomonas savastanoi pv. glycinea]KPC43891.1 Uncharacterized protein AC496_4937 [Pseudomonas savastanoi pv. glycinea]KPC50215.1 Uncharacterized protein ABK00_1195 [Pseudomonas savastanoi pv. glycinea]KPX50444.1 Uncharacterized protein ALO37_02215 [Pseudomonas savastanoi pv. glycinea]